MRIYSILVSVWFQRQSHYQVIAIISYFPNLFLDYRHRDKANRAQNRSCLQHHVAECDATASGCVTKCWRRWHCETRAAPKSDGWKSCARIVPICWPSICRREKCVYGFHYAGPSSSSSCSLRCFIYIYFFANTKNKRNYKQKETQKEKKMKERQKQRAEKSV